jgi:Mrp family chromosome partitioning ATPase
MKIGVLRQFVDKISWGELDYMIVDLPPGTGDEPISVFQMLSPDGAIVVTTPDELSLMDAARSVRLARNLDVPVVGIIGNMSGIKCPFCGHEIARSCEEMIRSAAIGLGIPFLGAVDLDPAIASGGDSGRPFILDTVSSAAVLFEEIITRIIGVLEGDGNT